MTGQEIQDRATEWLKREMDCLPDDNAGSAELCLEFCTLLRTPSKRTDFFRTLISMERFMTICGDKSEQCLERQAKLADVINSFCAAVVCVEEAGRLEKLKPNN